MAISAITPFLTQAKMHDHNQQKPSGNSDINQGNYDHPARHCYVFIAR